MTDDLPPVDCRIFIIYHLYSFCFFFFSVYFLFRSFIVCLFIFVFIVCHLLSVCCPMSIVFSFLSPGSCYLLLVVCLLSSILFADLCLLFVFYLQFSVVCFLSCVVCHLYVVFCLKFCAFCPLSSVACLPFSVICRLLFSVFCSLFLSSAIYLLSSVHSFLSFVVCLQFSNFCRFSSSGWRLSSEVCSLWPVVSLLLSLFGRLSPVLYLIFSVFSFLSAVINHLSSVCSILSFAFIHLSYVNWLLFTVVSRVSSTSSILSCALQSVLHFLSSVISLLAFVFYCPSSVLYLLSSIAEHCLSSFPSPIFDRLSPFCLQFSVIWLLLLSCGVCRLFPVFYFLSFVSYRLSYVICLQSSVFCLFFVCPLSSVVCLSFFVACRSSPTYPLFFFVYRLPSVPSHLSSVVCLLSFFFGCVCFLTSAAWIRFPIDCRLSATFCHFETVSCRVFSICWFLTIVYCCLLSVICLLSSVHGFRKFVVWSMFSFSRRLSPVFYFYLFCRVPSIIYLSVVFYL